MEEKEKNLMDYKFLNAAPDEGEISVPLKFRVGVFCRFAPPQKAKTEITRQ